MSLPTLRISRIKMISSRGLLDFLSQIGETLTATRYVLVRTGDNKLFREMCFLTTNFPSSTPLPLSMLLDISPVAFSSFPPSLSSAPALTLKPSLFFFLLLLFTVKAKIPPRRIPLPGSMPRRTYCAVGTGLNEKKGRIFGKRTLAKTTRRSRQDKIRARNGKKKGT